jgi:Bacterial membrane protein YfhO
MTLFRPARRLFTSSWCTWLIAACVLAAVVLIGNSQLLLGKATPIWDADAYYGPMFSLVGDYAKTGKLFLWNPWMNGGSPDFADPQTGATSPILLAFAVLSTNPLHGFVAYWMTIWIFGGIGMLLLCRYLKCPVWGALIAALGFVASGFYTGHGQHTTILYSFSFLPWIIWRFDAAITRRSYRNMIEAGVLWGLSALGGYPALVIIDPIFLGLWGLGRAWLGPYNGESPVQQSRKNCLLFTIAGLCLFGIIGVAVMGPSYIGFLKYTTGYTTRVGGVSRSYAEVGPLPPQALGTFASPYLYLLNWPPYGIWRETDISMSNIYMGVLVITLAAIALRRRHKWRLWLGIVVVFFMGCAVGSHLPVRGWLYDFVPPTRYFRFPSLFSAYGIAALCILAAYGSRDIDLVRTAGEPTQRRRFVVLSIIVALAAFWAYRGILATAHLKVLRIGHPSNLFFLVWVSVVLLFLLWWKNDISARLLLVGLISIAIYDATSALKMSAPTMYSAATAPWWQIMTSRHIQSLDLTPNGLTRVLFPPDELGRYQHNRNVVLKIPVFANDTGMVNEFFQPYVADPVLNQLAVGAQRTWFSDDPVWLPHSQKTFGEYVKASHILGIPPLVLQLSGGMPRASGSTAAVSEHDSQDWAQSAHPLSRASIDLLKYFPNRLSFSYNASKDGWLLVTDRWAPYWKATVNGGSVDIQQGNFLFRAIPVQRGENTVVLHYEPRGYVGLVILSWGTIVIVLLWGIASRTIFRRAGRRSVYSSKTDTSPRTGEEVHVI